MTDRHDLSYERDLFPGEPAHPTSAVIVTAGGERITCELTRKDPSTWTARPPAPHYFRPGDRFLIDRLPAGAKVEFVDVIGPEGENGPGRGAPPANV